MDLPSKTDMEDGSVRVNLFHYYIAQQCLSGYYTPGIGGLCDRLSPDHILYKQHRTFVLDFKRMNSEESNLIAAKMLTRYMDRIRTNNPNLKTSANSDPISFQLRDLGGRIDYLEVGVRYDDGEKRIAKPAFWLRSLKK